MNLLPSEDKDPAEEKHGDFEELTEDQFGWSREKGGWY